MILPLQKILCPTDFSDPSYEGLKVADELARHFAAKLLLVHVVSPVPIMPATEGSMGTQIPMLLEQIVESARSSILEIAKQRVSAGVQAEAFVLEGTPAHEIARLAAEEKVDVIVIATHGQSGWKRFLSGSVTERVVRMAECPVLTVHVPKAEA